MIINTSRLRDDKLENLKQGRNAYAESAELIRLMKRSIERQHLEVYYDYTDTGCWFIPEDNRKTS